MAKLAGAAGVAHGSTKREPNSGVKGICKWCGTYRRLVESHIVPKFWGRSEKGRGQRIYIAYGRRAWLGQDGPKEHLLCTACEQEFGRYERRVSDNWRQMKGGTQRSRAGREIWKRGRWYRLQGPGTGFLRENGRVRPERWRGVDGEAWRRVAAATAWRAAVSSYRSTPRLAGQAAALKVLYETGRWEGRAIPLVFGWTTAKRVGQRRLEGGMPWFEMLPKHNARGDIQMQHGGITLTLAVGESLRPEAREYEERVLREVDIQEDGTWLVSEVDWTEGPLLRQFQRMVNVMQPVHTRTTRRTSLRNEKLRA